MAKWKNGYQPQVIATKLESGKILSKDSGVSFTGINYPEFAFLINSMLDVAKSIPETEKSRLVGQAISRAGARGKITEQRLLAAAKELESEYLSRSLSSYRLLTAISIPRNVIFPAFRHAGSVIIVNPKLSKRAIAGRRQCIEDARDTLFCELPSRYTPVSISVSARSDHEAADTALDRFDLLRGIWNLAINRGHSWRMSWGRRKPVNVIVAGPIHTLHYPNGALATEDWWYESDYQGPTDLWQRTELLPNVLKFTSRFRKSLQISPVREPLTDALIRYVRALDNQNWQSAFMQLWGILELLTNTKRAKYDETIRRAMFLFKEREYAKEVLNQLREFRNRSVHAGADTDHIETLMYQSKRYVESLICFIVLNSFGFKSMKEVGDFLSIDPDTTAIKRHIERLKYAESFLSTD